MTVIETISGRFEGSGRWHDTEGKSMDYAVIQSNHPTAEGFEVEFTHTFRDGTETRAHFRMTWLTAKLFRVDMGETSAGNGHCTENSCRYYIRAGKAFVEVSYQPARDGGLDVVGSSTENAEGNYIAWHEKLRRMD